jgi:hypothetical protein
VDGQWLGCDSKEPLALLKWAHVAGTFDPASGFTLYVNGQRAGAKAANGNIPVMNLKSKQRHFVIGEAGAHWKPFRCGAREGFSTMPCWNHYAALEFTLAGNSQSPVLNPAFIVKNWGAANVTLTLDGKPISRGKDFRFGHRQTLEGTDLIVWIETESHASLTFRLQPQAQP